MIKGSIPCISLPGTGCRWESLVDPAKPKPVPGILFQHLKTQCRIMSLSATVYIDMTWWRDVTVQGL